MSIGLDYLSEW